MRSIALVANPSRKEAVECSVAAITRLLDEGVEVLVEPALTIVLPETLVEKLEVKQKTEFEKFVDVIISVGGDGTLLSVAKMLMGSDVPIMGVNVGKLGFLAEFSAVHVEDSIMDILKGNFRVVDRTTVQTTIAGTTYYALNEMLLERTGKAKMIAVRAFVNDHHVADYRADGVIVTTPTGSTAYSLAAGGPIIAPSSSALCITPISPHTLTLRPLIVNDNSEIRFEMPFVDTYAQVVADGQIIAQVHTNDVITIKRSEHLVKLIKRAESTYYDVLREKLLWSSSAANHKQV